MSEVKSIRWGWLKAMYILTIIIAGGFGLGIIFFPDQIKSFFLSSCDPIPYGIEGSVFLAFSLLAMLGLRDPLKFVPILLLQLTYKTVWLVAIVLPLIVTGRFPASYILTVVIFMLFIVGDVIAIPFSYVFKRQTDS